MERGAGADGEIPDLAEFAATRFAATELAVAVPQIHVARGHIEEAKAALEPFQAFAGSADVQERTAYEAAHATILRADGSLTEAFASASAAFEARREVGATHPAVKLGFVEAAEAAFGVGALDDVVRLLTAAAGLGAGDTTPYV